MQNNYFVHKCNQDPIKKLEHFGFDVFRDFIDRPYDEEQDLVKRITMCVKEIERLKDNIMEIYQCTAQRRAHNPFAFAK